MDLTHALRTMACSGKVGREEETAEENTIWSQLRCCMSGNAHEAGSGDNHVGQEENTVAREFD